MNNILLFLTSLALSPLFSSLTLNAQPCTTGKINPEVANFLKRIPPDNRSLEEMRSSPNFAAYKKDGPPAIPYPAGDVKRIKVTGDSIPILVFNPSQATGLPVIINYHPGGFITPLTAGMEYLAWKDAQTFNAVVFAIDYRVAPENKFPAAVIDCYNAFRWISENATAFGGDTSRIAVMGQSAGANLAAVVCQKAKRDGIVNRIKLQILNSPVLDNGAHADLYPSMKENANGYMLTRAGVLFALETYADEKDHNNPEYAPILDKDLSGLPPAVMITAEFDPLRDQGGAYADSLRKAGVKVWHHCFGGEIHCLIFTPGAGTSAKTYHQLVSTALNETLRTK